MIPGGNLLNLAMSAIQKQQLGYVAYAGRALAANGDYVPAYLNAVTIGGSIQPIKRSLYENMGLDFQKNYVNIFVPNDINDIKRASAGDQFTFKEKTFQVLSNEEWFQMDGWDQVLCVEVPTVVMEYITQYGFAYTNEAGNQLYIAE